MIIIKSNLLNIKNQFGSSLNQYLSFRKCFSDYPNMYKLNLKPLVNNKLTEQLNIKPLIKRYLTDEQFLFQLEQKKLKEINRLSNKNKDKKKNKIDNRAVKNAKLEYAILKEKRKNKFLANRLLGKTLEKKLQLLTTRNPYILVRKNYKYLFKEFFNQKLITPLVLDFLHLAYFKLNINKLYRPRTITKLDSYAKRMYRYTLSTFKTLKLSKQQYLFTLMKKKTFLQKLLDLTNTQSLYTRTLHQLYYFQKVKKGEFNKFLDCPPYLDADHPYIDFHKYDALRFEEYSYIQQILEFYYPVTEIHFKETHIHGKPMKTKLPRRI